MHPYLIIDPFDYLNNPGSGIKWNHSKIRENQSQNANDIHSATNPLSSHQKPWKTALENILHNDFDSFEV